MRFLFLSLPSWRFFLFVSHSQCILVWSIVHNVFFFVSLVGNLLFKLTIIINVNSTQLWIESHANTKKKSWTPNSATQSTITRSSDCTSIPGNLSVIIDTDFFKVYTISLIWHRSHIYIRIRIRIRSFYGRSYKEIASATWQSVLPLWLCELFSGYKS